MRRFLLASLVVALASVALASCDMPPQHLVCTRDGKTVYRSASASYVAPRDRADSWIVGDTYYTPEPGTTCRAEPGR